MYGRWFNTVVICFWFSAMSWLAAEKILPAFFNGDPPDYQIAVHTPRDEPDCWKITWQGRALGFSASQLRRAATGQLELRSIVCLERLPVKTMASELLGPLAGMAEPLFARHGRVELDMLIATQMKFDTLKRLQSLRTMVDLAGREGFLLVEGDVSDSGRLRLTAWLHNGAGKGLKEGVPVLSREIDLPADTLISDTLTPRTELRNLSLGQTWTFPVYRAFPPNHPVQIVQGQVEQHEIILWDSRDVETMLVVYRAAGGPGLNLADGTLGREWVRRDGVILQQEVSFSGLKLRFERLPAAAPIDARKAWLNDDAQPRFWTPTSGPTADPEPETSN